MSEHDRNFKDVFTRWPRETVFFLFPEQASALPPDTEFVLIRQETDSLFSGGPFYILDVPILAKHGNDITRFDIFAPEHHSDGEDDDVLKAGMYAIYLCRKYKTRRIHLKLVFQNPGAAPHEIKLGDERHTSVHLNFEIAQLTEMNALDYVNSTNVVTTLCALFMKFTPAERLDVIKCAMQNVVDSVDNKSDLKLFLGFIDRYAGIQQEELPVLLQKLNRGKEDVMATYQGLHASGVAEGVAKGAAKMVWELVKDGIITTAQARDRLLAMRNKGPEDAQAADEVLKLIGDRD